MKILVLQGSPRAKGNTRAMVAAFAEGATSAGHQVDVLDVCEMDIHGCVACEFCHTRGKGACAQQDDMQKVYTLLNGADMLVVAAPIYFHDIPGQIKCAVDRFYAVFDPQHPGTAQKGKKFAAILTSAMPGVHDAATAVLRDSLAAGLGFEVVGICTASGVENGAESTMAKMREFGKSL